jgi:hypothetical protein
LLRTDNKFPAIGQHEWTMERIAEANHAPMISAGMDVLRAIQRHHVREFDTTQKPHHWGKRELKRDE